MHPKFQNADVKCACIHFFFPILMFMD